MHQKQVPIITKEVEMTKRETYCTVLGLKVWATAGLMLILVLSSGMALAAQIDITNCTTTEVKMCAYSGCDTAFSGCYTMKHSRHQLQANETKHFTCHARCVFTMTAKHPDASCEKPHRDGMGHGYHSFGRSGYDGYGTDSYTLVKLDQNTTNGNWEIDDLQSGSTCP